MGGPRSEAGESGVQSAKGVTAEVRPKLENLPRSNQQLLDASFLHSTYLLENMKHK